MACEAGKCLKSAGEPILKRDFPANPGDLATMHTALDSKQENETNALQQPCWPSNNKVGGVGNAEVQSTEFKLRNLWVGLQMQGTFIICKGEYAK